MQVDKIEEALEIIWKQKELNDDSIPKLQEELKKEIKENILDYLIQNNYIIKQGDKVKFTEQGEKIALNITRRHRLAERLLFDVLAVEKNEVESNACVFEHILSPGVEENICVLLGHPRECPHGMLIPEGECCRKAKTVIESIVIPLSQLKSGSKGKVAYVLTHNHPHLHKLMSMGIVPGTDIYLHQIFPSFIIMIGETQLALEKEIAKDIYVRRE
ncbi:MAG: metal-dependent transcriptional regulator [Candidatus Firestonebacteria bacterium]|nr:metal-dependent transcriptional regulator [Candidatus Firestonebacteria bacterium]